jgi:hypothetical protein
MSRALPAAPAGALLVLGLLSAACRGTERDNAEPSASRGDSTVATADSAATCPPSAEFKGSVNDHGAAAAAGATLSLEAGDSYFAPTCETRVPVGVVTLVVKNTGQLLLNISFPDQGIDESIARGETIRVKVKVGAQPLHFNCKYHWTAGMVGALLPK